MNNKVKTLKISKAETLNEALKIQKEITGHYFYEGFVWDHYKNLDT